MSPVFVTGSVLWPTTTTVLLPVLHPAPGTPSSRAGRRSLSPLQSARVMVARAQLDDVAAAGGFRVGWNHLAAAKEGVIRRRVHSLLAAP